MQMDGNVSIISDVSNSSQNSIPVHITNRTQSNNNSMKYGPMNLLTVHRSNKYSQTLHLPKVCNINPQSIYNKKDEFISFVNEMEADVIFISESWERLGRTLETIMEPLVDHTVISNVHQRQGRGGRPAIVINSKKYQVQNITQSVINIPWGVEVVWAVITPKGIQCDSLIQKIVCGSVYHTTAARSQAPLLDHITDVYNILTTKYPRGLHWILAGDFNRVKLDTILNLDPRLKQIVQSPTRLNPNAILDPIIMTLNTYYQIPKCLPPLDADDGETQSDHLIVFAEPLSSNNIKPARTLKKVKLRLLPDSGKIQMLRWFKEQSWDEVIREESCHEKAIILQSLIMDNLDKYLPEKTVNFSSDDQPWFTPELKLLDKQRKLEYKKHRRSFRWKALNKKFKTKILATKASYYKKRIEDLKEGKPGQWYSLLKRLCSHDQMKSDQPECQEIQDKTDKEQAELIADKFASVSNKFSPINANRINVPLIL